MGAQEKSPNENNSLQRVKVYRLNDDGKWDDQGTGHVTVDYLERSEEVGLLVVDEADNETLLLHRISSDDIYRKQEDTIISWRDPEYSTELALSFQETTGCAHIWEHICNVQRNMQLNNLNSDRYHSINSELRELPPVEISTLPLILKAVVESGIADQLRLIELMLHDEDIFRKLMSLFRICEDLEDMDSLHIFFKIVKGIIFLNSSQIFEKIFGDELIMDIIGCLEYDPDVPHVHHRNFLKENVVFKEAIPIKDPVVLSKIHQTYRVGYLKDVILPRALDDATGATLTNIIHTNNAYVVSILKDDSTFIHELFVRLKSPAVSEESKENLVRFLHEFCTLSKSLQMVQQLRLFKDLVDEGIFDIVSDVLQSQDKKLVLTGTDILILFLNQDPNLLRSYVTRQEGLSLFGLLVKGMLTDFGDDMHCQFLEILRSLLDSYNSGTQRDNIVEIFYEKHLGQLIDAITSSCPPNTTSQSKGTEKQSSVKPEILLNICDLLCFCVMHHPYRIKCDFLLNNVIDKVLFLTQRREKYLIVSAVRFMRTLISRNDEHLMNHIVKNNLLKPIVDAFVANGNRYNLLNSAVLELFEYIRKVHDTSGARTVANPVDTRKRVDERALEKEEEDYFNEDSDEEDSTSVSVSNANRVQSRDSRRVVANGSAPSYPAVRSGGLVDYDDDEDDEDYKPPPKKQLDTSDEDGVESFPLKRKLTQKEEPNPKRLQRAAKTSSKSRNSVFAALCSTLSQAVLPSSISANIAHDDDSCSGDPKDSTEAGHEKGSFSDSNGSVEAENHVDKEEISPKNFAEGLSNSPDNRQWGDDGPLIQQNSSPEMAVNGS
ncbi:PREDICTED: serine/threonine-protein phosphatase 4 regulatory subunit 3 isoform X2 [Ipomoea nil]|uniref:serine/threonine-protein phosphatase 4 regulatory subunit 3 isoform X2 n=1 Tax=Ipomoea nil TaxID=35883 RepID=UPI00090186CC|nr:PREDICTED: serine/threonine-protein phosphatase 4 regulatory subunit 3 isoform X2 [Ipomoea nil]